jgi:PAB-dependent poly(A)-specific ribonuclease subunit 3
MKRVFVTGARAFGSCCHRAIHGSGLACRAIEPSRILLTGRNRARVNGVGILDVLTYDPAQNPQAMALHYQVRAD